MPHPSAVVLPLFQARILIKITIVFPGDEATRLNQVEANPIRKVVTLLQDMQKDGAGPMSKDEFLKQFPKNVISKGEIVPIREELEQKFKKTGKIDVSKLNNNEPIEAPTDIALNPENYNSSDIVTLRIRTETGKRTIIVKLLKTDKMSLLYDYVSPYIEFDDKPYELRSKFPNKAYEENEVKNMQDLGLAPSSALVVASKQ